MLLQVEEFCRRVETDINSLVDDLQQLTGRYGDEERRAWLSSLPMVSMLLANDGLADFRACHLHLGQRGGLALEYRLPASSSWCDLVLLGQGHNRPAAVVVELKDWQTSGDLPGPTSGLVVHQGRLELHPSEQVRAYAEYCRRFHSTVLETDASLDGCVYFTRPVATAAYTTAPHDVLTDKYPVFTSATNDLNERFPDYLRERLVGANADFAVAFERGTYRQDRSFCVQVAAQIENPQSSPFELLDSQRRGFELCKASIRSALQLNDPSAGKTVIVVKGPPGSGKSVLAARLWAELVRSRDLPGNHVLTTTSSSQRSNWEDLFARTAGGPAGKGLVMPANRYAPEQMRWVKKYRDANGGKEAMPTDEWRENIERCRAATDRLSCPDDSFTVSIVDEAHALINSEHALARAAQSGWADAFGPQAYHIIRASRVSIFLLDSEQSFRERETTTADDIARFAAELGAAIATPIDLAGQQFRAAGSVDYVDWVESTLDMREPISMPRVWRSGPAPTPTFATDAHVSVGRDAEAVYGHDRESGDGRFLFEVADDPADLEERLRLHANRDQSVRLVATYARPWKTKDKANPHLLPASEQDFDIRFDRRGVTQRWSRIWNFAPGDDYTLFVQAPKGSRMHDDPLCEVGCPYVVRGFDYDYLGLLWMEDLVWRGDRWTFDPASVHESGIRTTLSRARKEHGSGGKNADDLLRRLKQAYRILLTRALKGVYVWFADDETRRHVESLLPSQ